MQEGLPHSPPKTWLFNGIKMAYAITKYPKLNTIVEVQNHENAVRLHFGLKGDYRFKYGNLQRSFDLIGGHHNILYSDGIELEIENKSLEIETFGINFPRQIFSELLMDDNEDLEPFMAAVEKKESTILSDRWGSLTSPIQTTLDEMIFNPYQGKLEDLYLYAKSIEVLVLCLSNYSITKSSRFKHLKTNTDKEAIIAARDFLNTRISNPPDLNEIARKVGINAFKLKYGFKEMFGTTLFAYLTDKRLNLATIMLRDSKQSIARIAEDLGYSSPQHFSSQYKSRFGKSPSKIRKAS